MHFLTVVEAREWCRDRVELTDAGVPTRPSREQRFARGPTSDEVAFCRQLERALQGAFGAVVKTFTSTISSGSRTEIVGNWRTHRHTSSSITKPPTW